MIAVYDIRSYKFSLLVIENKTIAHVRTCARYKLSHEPRESSEFLFNIKTIHTRACNVNCLLCLCAVISESKRFSALRTGLELAVI